ncbi:hypothetical protein BZG36_05423 [Bifiguratus adelaidae]|uniref:Fungal-type protein kinase domain-containing protein n=1 Tax=Bifiguratus adelaidae TaxID=1938954 RepID=A0A261XTC2_9FUNG|nr:hypothetical protein BZG36_05423 [Bifiguratus adelaidae]
MLGHRKIISAYRTDPVVDGSPPFKRSGQYLEKETEQPSNDFGAESGEAISEDKGDLETEAHKAQRTGTIPYMASGVLLGEAHSVQHDLESFFYVLTQHKSLEYEIVGPD